MFLIVVLFLYLHIALNTNVSSFSFNIEWFLTFVSFFFFSLSFFLDINIFEKFMPVVFENVVILEWNLQKGCVIFLNRVQVIRCAQRGSAQGN